MNLYESDHFPIILTLLEGRPAASTLRYVFQKADWPLFNQMGFCNCPIDSFGGVEEAIEYFRDLIDRCAKAAIPRTKGSKRTRQVPGETTFDRPKRRGKVCKTQYRSKLAVDKIPFQRARARVTYLTKTFRVNSWKQYTEGLNKRTSMNKV